MLDTYIPGCVAEALVRLTENLRDEAKKADISETYRNDIVVWAEAVALLANKTMESLEELDGAILRWQEGWGPSE